MGVFRNMFSSLYHRDYRNFWFGQVVSTTGSMVQVTVLSWYVYQISGSPFLLGLMGVFEFGPVLTLILFVGVLIERFPKRNILLFTQGLLLVQSLLLAFLVWTGSTNYWFFAMLALIGGIAMSIDQPTRQSYFVELVGEKDLPNAISLNSTTFNLARIIGPIIAGILMKYVGVAECFLLNGLSFIPVLYGISLIKIKKMPDPASFERQILNGIKKGFQYAVRNRNIFPTFLIMLAVCTFSMNIGVTLPVLAKDVLQGNESTYSILMSVFGIGSLSGALFMGSKGQNIPSKNFLVMVALFMTILHVMAFFACRSFIVVAILLACIGFLTFCFLNRANTRIQLNTSDDYRSRVMSMYILITTGTAPLGNTFSGFIMKQFGGEYALLFNGLITLVLVSALYFIYHNYLEKAKVVPVSEKDRQDIANVNG
jgi:predicted MFS family arabinose efflux permease